MIGDLYRVRSVTYAAIAFVALGLSLGAIINGDWVPATFAFGGAALAGIAAWGATG